MKSKKIIPIIQKKATNPYLSWGANKLSKIQKKMLRPLVAVLMKNAKLSLESAKALYVIREKRLFRGHGNSLKKFGALFGYEPANTTRLAQTGGVWFKLESTWKKKPGLMPTAAWQLRPLCSIKDDKLLKKIWKAAVKKSEGKLPTVSVLEECVADHSGVAKPTRAKPNFIRLDLDLMPGLIEHALYEGLESHQIVIKAVAAYINANTPMVDDPEVSALFDDLLLGGLFR